MSNTSKSEERHIVGRTSYSRTSALSQLGQDALDVLVIGGGIAGACAVWDASLRGLRAGLIERSDFSSGTSAHSLRVLHGGIRYLQHLDLARLSESCAERGAFLRIAPHLTRPMPFALPTYGMGLRGKLPLRAAFAMLNVLTAGRNRGTALQSQQIPSPYCMSRSTFLQKFPAFDHPDLTGAGVFYDGQICNPPRVVYSIIRDAQERGALVANYCSAERLLVRDGKIQGVVARDCIGDASFEIHARVVVNLTGPFAPTVNESAFGGQRINVPLSRDMAFVINRKLLPDMALGIQTRYRDPDAWLSRGNRHIFIVPWRSYTLIGVNSRVYEDDPFKLTVSPEEIQGFVEEIREACPVWNITREDVAVVNAGLLPIGEGAQGQKGLSLGKRSPMIDHATGGGPDGLITGMSVRWTMGRQVAQAAIDLAAQKLGAQSAPCLTASTPVHGGDISDKDKLLASVRATTSSSLPEKAITHLVDTFGTEASAVLRQGDETLLPDGQTLEAEVRQAARNEMVETLADIVLRRLDLGTGSQLSDPMLVACSRVAAEELGWDARRQAEEISRVKTSYPFANPGSQQF